MQDSKNGFVFSTSDELCQKLIQLAGGFPRDIGLLDKFQREIRLNRTTETWQKVWDREARLYFTRRSKPIGLYTCMTLLIDNRNMINLVTYSPIGLDRRVK